MFKKELLVAIMLVESGGDPNAVGDRHLRNQAHGPLQIRQPLVDDLNRFCAKEIRQKFGRDRLLAEDFLSNVALSCWAFERYIGHYATRKRLGREPTDEDRARIWNGGPNGWRNPKTKRYWEKCVKARLAWQRQRRTSQAGG